MDTGNTAFVVKPETLIKAPTDTLRLWSTNPNCKNTDEVLAEIDRRASAPFNPRTEMSADGRAIRKTIWIVGFLVPLIIGIILALLMPHP